MGAWYAVQNGTEVSNREAAFLRQLDLLGIEGDREVPLNTILKEIPDKLKSDLIAICIASGSRRAFVLRVQVKLGQSRSEWSGDAKQLAEKGPEVLEVLGRAKNLAGVELVHVPVWMAPHITDTHAAKIEQAGVRVVRGQEFWDMQIPHVRAVAWLLPRTGAPKPSEDNIHQWARAARPEVLYTDSVCLVETQEQPN